MPRAIRIHEAGGPEVMRLEDVDVSAPAAGEVQVQHTAIGLNYIDVYDRSGLYPQAIAGRLGREAAGIVSGRWARGAWLSQRRSRRLCAFGAGLVLRVAQCAGRAAGEDSGRRQRRAGRGAHAQGHDRLLSTAAHATA